MLTSGGLFSSWRCVLVFGDFAGTEKEKHWKENFATEWCKKYIFLLFLMEASSCSSRRTRVSLKSSAGRESLYSCTERSEKQLQKSDWRFFHMNAPPVRRRSSINCVTVKQDFKNYKLTERFFFVCFLEINLKKSCGQWVVVSLKQFPRWCHV